MAKKLTLFSLRLMLLNIVSIFIMLLLLLFDNDIYRWIMNILLTFTLWAFVWRDCASEGQKDVQKEKIIKRKMTEDGFVPAAGEDKVFQKWFGFAAGLLSQVPVILVIVVSYFMDDIARLLLQGAARFWYFTYSQLTVTLENSLPGSLPHALFLFALLFSVVAGLGYLNGPAQQQRLETIIERNKAKKAKRVQDDAKDKKKAQQRKQMQRR